MENNIHYKLLWSTKIFRYMRLILFFILIGLLPLEATVLSQNPNLNVEVNEMAMRDALRKIEQESGMRFFMSDDLSAMNEIVRVKTKGMSFDEIMKQVLGKHGLSYKIIDNGLVIITEKNQDKMITGTVTDKNNEPLPGVNIQVKGSSTGVITDIDGNYMISISDENAVLVFSYIGFLTQEIAPRNQSTLNVILSEDTKQLEEVVIVGYGTQKRVNITGAVAKVEGKEMTRMNPVNTTKSLQGMTPGITVIDRGGAPGNDDPNVYLRGVGTTGSASPLVLVDGIEMPLSQIPAYEIENVSILKDASSSSIYGSRAAHGVILVTTKRGKVGKMRLSYDGYIGLQDRAIKAKNVSAREYMEMVNESSVNAGNNPIFKEEDIAATVNGTDPYKHAYINYPDQVYKSNYVTEHNLGVSGGNENGRYLMSFNYMDQPGLTKNSSLKRYNYRLNTDVNVGSKLKVSGDVLYRHTDRLLSQRQGDAERSAWSMVPTVPVRYENGNYATDNQRDNPVASLDFDAAGKEDYMVDVLSGQIKADYQLIEGLTLTGMAAINGSWDRKKTHTKNYKFYNADNEFVTEWNPQNKVEDKRDNNYQITLRFLANYNKKFNKVHDLSVLYGMEQISFRGYMSKAERRNLISDALPEVSLGSASNQYAEGSVTRWGINSFFGRINYGFKDKYLFEANLRADGASRFASGDKWGVFPSVSAAWRLSEEAFLKDVTFVDNLKLRVSWGQTGNERIADPSDSKKQVYFGYLPQYGVEDVVMDGKIVTGVRQSQMANPFLTWETVESTDVGMEFNLFGNSVYGEFDFYTKDTRDILLNLAIPKFIGLDPPPQNAGVVRNTGFEAMLGYRKTFGEVSFNGNVNFSYNHNKWIDRGGDDENIDDWTIQKKGYALNSFYIFKADGLIANEKELEEYKAKYKSDPRGMSALQPGDIKFVDTNNDGTIDNDDRKVYAPNIPKYTAGLNLNAEYRNFDLSLFFQGAFGSYRYIYGEWYEGPSYEAFTGLHFRDRWTPENQNPKASVPRLEAATNRNLSSYNTFFMQNNSYVRLKNVQLGYTLPYSLTAKVGIERIRLYISGSNLFTISGMDQGLDPETESGRSVAYPAIKNMIFGVNVSF